MAGRAGRVGHEWAGLGRMGLAGKRTDARARPPLTPEPVQFVKARGRERINDRILDGYIYIYIYIYIR